MEDVGEECRKRGKGRTVGTVNHHDFPLFLFPEGFPGVLDAFGVEVCFVVAATKDDEPVLVAGCASNGRQALFRDTHKVVFCGCGAHGINGNRKGAVCAILEAHGKREATG